eukprot:57642-Prymnesium_polylepis.1
MFVASDIAFGGSRVACSRFAASVAGCTPFRDAWSRGQNSGPMLTQIYSSWVHRRCKSAYILDSIVVWVASVRSKSVSRRLHTPLKPHVATHDRVARYHIAIAAMGYGCFGAQQCARCVRTRLPSTPRWHS